MASVDKTHAEISISKTSETCVYMKLAFARHTHNLCQWIVQDTKSEENEMPVGAASYLGTVHCA